MFDESRLAALVNDGWILTAFRCEREKGLAVHVHLIAAHEARSIKIQIIGNDLPDATNQLCRTLGDMSQMPSPAVGTDGLPRYPVSPN